MKVVIDVQLFEGDDARRDLLLDSLWRFGLSGQHIILASVIGAHIQPGPVRTWIERLPGLRCKALMDLLDRMEAAAPGLTRGTLTVNIVAEVQSDWMRRRLCLDDAVRLLARPLRLLLENRRNDLSFLKRLAPPSLRRALDEDINNGWIEEEQGGGLPEIKVRLEELITAPASAIIEQIALLRLWVMFDRDSDPADRRDASLLSIDVHELCVRARIPHVQLGRRSQESYLPVDLLHLWQARGSTPVVRERRGNSVEALRQLNRLRPQARWQYNMKEGLMGDIKRERRDDLRRLREVPHENDLDPLFRGLPAEVVEGLLDGFGRDIGQLFREAGAELEPLLEEDYRAGPPHQPSREHLLISLLERR